MAYQGVQTSVAHSTSKDPFLHDAAMGSHEPVLQSLPATKRAIPQTFEEAYILPPKLHKTKKWLWRGNTGHVYRANSDIAIKYINLEREPKPYSEGTTALFANEVKVNLILNKQPSRFIVRCFFTTPEAIFLELIEPSINLAQYYAKEQEHDAQRRVIKYTGSHSRDTLLRWMYDLAAGAAWVEAQGLVHDDLHPRNLLTCKGSHLKLVDFDRAAPPGSLPQYGLAPYGVSEPDAHATVIGADKLGPATESFAIGSTCYFMTRGFDPYEDELGLGDGVECQNRFDRREFPRLDSQGDIDRIIDDCWNFRFESVALLRDSIELLGGDTSGPCGISDEHYSRCRSECEAMVAEGLLDLDESEGAVKTSESLTADRARIDKAREAEADPWSFGFVWRAVWAALEAQSL